MGRAAFRIQIQKNRRGKFYFRIVAANGEKVAHSESYASRRNCERTARRIAETTDFEIE